MGNVVTNVCEKFHCGRLGVDEALGNFRKSDNNVKNKNTFIALGTFLCFVNKVNSH